MTYKMMLAGLIGVCGLATAADAQVTFGRGGVTVGNPGYYGGGPGVNFGRGGVTYNNGFNPAFNNNGFYNYGAPYSYNQFSPRYGYNSGYQFARPVYGAGYAQPGVVYNQPGVVYSQPTTVQSGVIYSTPTQMPPVTSGVVQSSGTTTGTVVQSGGTTTSTPVLQAGGTMMADSTVIPAGAMMTTGVPYGYDTGMSGCSGAAYSEPVVYSDGGKRKKRGLRRR